MHDIAWFFFSLGNTPQGNCTHGEIRLVGGVSEVEGRVEICVNNAWGTICDTGFNSDSAKVICRSAGQPTEGTNLE